MSKGTRTDPGLPFYAILFDLGSTLIYFDGEWPEVIQKSNLELLQSLRAAGVPIGDGQAFLAQFRARLERYYAERETEFIEFTTAYLLRTLLSEWGFPEISDVIIRQALARMYAVSQAHWKVETDAHPTLQWLRQQGYRLGLISNAGDDHDVQTLVDQAHLRPYFDIILTSAALGIRKPNPRIFHAALDYWGIQPSQAAMVGDTLGADILGARNAGLYSIWLTRRANASANRAHEETIRPDAIITTLSELPPLLESL